MSLENNIKKWVILDNNHKKLNEQLKEIRDKKNELNDTIINYFNNNNITSPTINISDGKLNIIKTKIPNVLTYKYLEECLNQYFDNNSDKVKDIMEFIKNKRTFSETTNIKRFYNKE